MRYFALKNFIKGNAIYSSCHLCHLYDYCALQGMVNRLDCNLDPALNQVAIKDNPKPCLSLREIKIREKKIQELLLKYVLKSQKVKISPPQRQCLPR